MMEELQAASRSKEPGKVYGQHHSHVRPLVRASLELRPASGAKDERKGKLVVRLFVWRGLRGVPHEPFFKSADEWEGARAASAARRRNPYRVHSEASALANPLESTMEVVL